MNERAAMIDELADVAVGAWRNCVGLSRAIVEYADDEGWRISEKDIVDALEAARKRIDAL